MLKLSVDNPDEALKYLLLEASRRGMEVAKSCYWRMKSGRLIAVGEMSDEHLERTIALLRQINEMHEIIMEGIPE